MIRTLLLCGVCLVPGSFAAAVEEPANPRPAVEKKLLGEWKGGPCMGTIHFEADGTFERRHYSPGNNRVAGTWELRWDALPPTLTFHGKTSDDPERLNKDFVVKLVELNDETLRYQYADEQSAPYERVKK